MLNVLKLGLEFKYFCSYEFYTHYAVIINLKRKMTLLFHSFAGTVTSVLLGLYWKVKFVLQTLSKYCKSCMYKGILVSCNVKYSGKKGVEGLIEIISWILKNLTIL